MIIFLVQGQRIALSAKQADFLELTFEKHRDSLCNYALYLCKSDSMTDDLVQAVFHNIILHGHTGKLMRMQSNVLKSYLLTSVRNKWLDLSSKQSREGLPEDIDEYEPVLSGAQSAEDTALSRIDLQHVRQCIDEMPEPLRDVIKLHFANGWGIEDIANALQITPSGVKSRLHRARCRMRAAVGD